MVKIFPIFRKEEIAPLEIKDSFRKKKTDEEREKKIKEIKELYNKEEITLFQKKERISYPVFLNIILAIFFSLIAGAFATFFLLTREKIKLPLLGEISTKAFPSPVIEQTVEKKVTVSQDIQVNKLIEDFKKVIWQVFPSKITEWRFLEQIYLPNERKGLAYTLTSDGWLATDKTVIEEGDVVIGFNGQVFPISEIIKDDLTNLAFIKIEATDLEVVKFASDGEIKLGQQIIVYNGRNEVIFTFLRSLNGKPAKRGEEIVRSTDRYFDYFKLNDNLEKNFLGGPVFNLEGDLIGTITLKDEEILIGPIWQYKETVPDLLKEKKVRRVFLGINYINIEESLGLKAERYYKRNYGAIVYGNPEILSPAGLSGIKNADIILKVNGLSLEGKNLTRIIQEARPGQKLTLTILREGEELEIGVILENF